MNLSLNKSCMNNTLIEYIRDGVLTNKWYNKSGHFEYYTDEIIYRFIETDKNLKSYLYTKAEQNEINTPFVLIGFIAYLISNWGESELNIYEGYNLIRKQQYIGKASKEAGSFKRDLEAEFSTLLLKTEQEYIRDFTNNFDYIGQDEKNKLLEYANAYIEYSSQTYSTPVVVYEESFNDLVEHPNKEKLMAKLHDLLDHKKGKGVAVVMRALQDLKFIRKNESVAKLHSLITAEFEDIGSVKNFRNYMNETSGCNIQEDELNPIIEDLKQV